MFNIRRFSLVSFCLGLGLALLLPWLNPWGWGLQVSLSQNESVPLTVQAQRAYDQGNLTQAIALWQGLIETYQQQGKPLEAAQLYGHQAQAYRYLGNWPQANQSLKQGLQLAQGSDNDILAELYNVQGTLQLAQGQNELARQTWKTAAQLFQAQGNPEGFRRSQLNQSKALMALGLYPQACQQALTLFSFTAKTCPDLSFTKLTQQLERLEVEPTTEQINAWLLLANTLRNVGQLGGSQAILEKLWTVTQEPGLKSEIAFHLGQLERANANPQKAVEWYQNAVTLAPRLNLTVQAQLALFKQWLEQSDFTQAETLRPVLAANLDKLPLSHNQLYAQLNFLEQLIDWKTLNTSRNTQTSLPSWENFIQQLQTIQQQAQAIADQRAENYSWGILGRVQSKNQQLLAAQQTTETAIAQAEMLNAPELLYRWQWQLAQIQEKQGQTAQAQTHYLGAIATLKIVTRDLVNNPDFQLAFQRNGEGLYRQFLNFLLTPNAQGTIPLEQLTLARQTLESLQVEELNNFFRAVCLTAQPQNIDQRDEQTAVIYPIILPNRLALILSLPNQPLQVVSSPIDQAQLTMAIAQLRQGLVTRSRRDFYAPAQQLYQAIIQPLEPILKQQTALKTLVFVPDGALRNIPLGTLYDGRQFLIERYQVAITPGLTLLASAPNSVSTSPTLFAGITENQGRSQPLLYVEQELNSVQSQTTVTPLLNQNFVPNQLQRRLTYNRFEIVHLASHGRFSSQLQDTFIDTWEKPLNVTELVNLLQRSNPTGENAINLLILSACETAIGDQRAALGLAGMAVRSGAKSTLATLWSVNDEATAKFMGEFYQQFVTQKVSKAEALRQTQLALLKDPWFKHPFYWGAYILVGDWL